MNKQIKQTIAESPWSTAIQICERLGIDDPDERKVIRDEIKILLEDSSIWKVGKRRGTRYALPGTPPRVEVDPNDKKLRTKISQRVKDSAGEPTTFASIQEVCPKLEVAELRLVISAMIADGEISRQGHGASTAYFYGPGRGPPEVKTKKKAPIKGARGKVTQKPKSAVVAKQSKPKVEEEDKPKPVWNSLPASDAVNQVLASLRAKRGYTLHDLTARGEKLGAAGLLFADEVVRRAKAGTIEYKMENIGDGYRAYYFRGSL